MDSSSTHRSTSLVTPSNKRLRCDNMSSDSEGDEVQLQNLEEKFTIIMGHESTAKLLLDLTVPFGVKFQNGKILEVLALPGEAKKLMADPIVSVWPLKRQTASEAELRHVLWSRKFRDLVDRDLSQYEYLSDDLCQRTFRKDGQEVAQKLAGALIQTETQVMLTLKVELNGRTQSEDPHSHGLAFPTWESYVVEATTYEDTRRILIGTATWSALVTSAIILTTGHVIVGPDNTTFQTSEKLIRAMGDQDGEDVIKVNSSMNGCLESFAKDVQEIIATLNQDCVRKEIEARIKVVTLALMSWK
ncbi:hypothetical protein BGZ80_008055 [Entomortierella chlamydospora]|uniref:Uncharacterized protein n=1 Tax=Entomortierella chlamydospora TaxID=101097 RepID=A0A9P6MZ10_9FUNG|nr:hypothetical protein BGZ80_008055 [Entomortierella chlamydospora]